MSNNAQANTKSENSSIPENEGVEFLINEYNSLTDLWKHTDSRLESGVNLYLAASAVVVSAIVFFSERITDTYLFFSITAFATAGLAIAGIILSERLLATSFNKAEYIYARDLIRRYFAARTPKIGSYLYFFQEKRSKQLTRIPQTILFILHLWSSFLVWLSVSIVLWLISSSLSSTVIFTTSTVISVALFIYLVLNTRKKTNAFRFYQPDSSLKD